MAADREGFLDLAKWAMLASAKSSAIVYLPQEGHRPNWVKPPYESAALVFCHHSLQFPPSAWKRMRKYSARARLQTLSVRAPEQTSCQYRYKPDSPDADVFDFARHSDTIFFSASKEAFEGLANIFVNLSNAVESGEHNHLFGWVRGGEVMHNSRVDLTVLYASPHDWVGCGLG